MDPGGRRAAVREFHAVRQSSNRRRPITDSDLVQPSALPPKVSVMPIVWANRSTRGRIVLSDPLTRCVEPIRLSCRDRFPSLADPHISCVTNDLVMQTS